MSSTAAASLSAAASASPVQAVPDGIGSSSLVASLSAEASASPVAQAVADTSSNNALDTTISGLLRDGTGIVQEGERLVGPIFNEGEVDQDLVEDEDMTDPNAIASDEVMAGELRQKREGGTTSEPRKSNRRKKGKKNRH